MGYEIWQIGLCFWICLISYSSSIMSLQFVVGDGTAVEGTVLIDGKAAIGKIDDDFICATMDWWPPDKCDYGKCSWDHASLLNVDLTNNILLNAVKAFSPLKIRLGGSLEDKVIYDTEDNQQPCIPFVKNASDMFGFTGGCLPLQRWDELNAFFKKSGAKVIFGLNALPGRLIQSNGSAVGAWNYTNAESLIRYTVKKNFSIHGWELGNELGGKGIGASVAADQYASDTKNLHSIVQNAYKGVDSKPLIVAPGGNFDANWFKEFIDKTTNHLDVASHHIYSLGPGVDEHLVEKILNSSYLDGVVSIFSGLQNIIRSSASSAVAWVGEAGGAYNSGRNLVTNAFVSSFWYLDQLGLASKYDTKTYCRQSLIGGNYGLLNTTTFVPNPDYYSALLWHWLMGRHVLSTDFAGSKNIRAYAHCAKLSQGITLLMINLDNSTAVQIKVAFKGDGIMQHKQHKSKFHIRKVLRSPRGYTMGETREEYHLTAKDGNLHSQTVLLNGKILNVDSAGGIPSLGPSLVNSSMPITVAPFSVVFIHMPYYSVPACM